MSIIAYLITAAAAYALGRPFVLVTKLKKDIADDLRDYYRDVSSLKLILSELLPVLAENGLLEAGRRRVIMDAYDALSRLNEWDDVARADRLAVQAIDEAMAVLSEVQEPALKTDLDYIVHTFYRLDNRLIDTRYLLHRDIPVLNRSLIHRSSLLARLFKIPTYELSEPIQWSEAREKKKDNRTYARTRRSASGRFARVCFGVGTV